MRERLLEEEALLKETGNDAAGSSTVREICVILRKLVVSSRKAAKALLGARRVGVHSALKSPYLRVFSADTEADYVHSAEHLI